MAKQKWMNRKKQHKLYLTHSHNCMFEFMFLSWVCTVTPENTRKISTTQFYLD